MKDIKDFLKYYIGKTKVCLPDPESKDGKMHFFLTAYNYNSYRDWHSDIRPYLRRLDSMTYDEFIEAGKIHVAAGGKIQITFEEVKSGHNRGTYPEVFHYLLSKGFDLFDLIDSGLAIDINQPN